MALRPDGTPIVSGVFGGRFVVDGFDTTGDIEGMEIHDMEDSHVPWMGDFSRPRIDWPAGAEMWDF